MADANQALRENVDEEASQKLVRRDRHDLLLAATSVVLPAEGDAIVLEGQEPMVGDSDTMRVAGQVVENMFRSAERWLGVDDPLLGKDLAQELPEAFRSRKLQKRAVELELALQQELLERGRELAAEDAAENAGGQEETL